MMSGPLYIKLCFYPFIAIKNQAVRIRVTGRETEKSGFDSDTDTRFIYFPQRPHQLLSNWYRDQSHPSSAEVKNAWSYTSTPHASS
jgi:hypothetical protein